MRKFTLLMTAALIIAIAVGFLSTPPGDAASPANVTLTYDCRNMRNPMLAVTSTTHASVEFTRLGTYRWRLRVYPDIGHPIRATLYETTHAHRIDASRGPLVRSVMEWIIPVKVLDGCPGRGGR